MQKLSDFFYGLDFFGSTIQMRTSRDSESRASVLGALASIICLGFTIPYGIEKYDILTNRGDQTIVYEVLKDHFDPIPVPLVVGDGSNDQEFPFRLMFSIGD